MRTNADRLENWHVLQELAGLRGGRAAAKTSAGAAAGNGHSQPLRVGDRIRYKSQSGWLDGSVDSLDPARLSLADSTQIQVTADILRQAVAAGIVKPA